MYDNVSLKVKDFYNKFPYPTNSNEYMNLCELLSLCLRFSEITQYDFDNKKVLDAGTGTGDRILEFAKFYPDSKILAVDFSQASLKLATMKANNENVDNVIFKEADILNIQNMNEKFDVIFSMGVIHHLASPQQGVKNLSMLLKPDGFLITYLYGYYGGLERMRQKQTIDLLAKNSNNLELKLKIAKQLKLELVEYGWIVEDCGSSGNQSTYDSLLADSFFNVNEKLYHYDEIYKLFLNNGFSGFNIFGITAGEDGLVVDFDLDKDIRFAKTEFENLKNSEFLRNIFSELSLEEKYKLLDLYYKPNGYSIISWPSEMTKTSVFSHFEPTAMMFS